MSSPLPTFSELSITQSMQGTRGVSHSQAGGRGRDITSHPMQTPHISNDDSGGEVDEEDEGEDEDEGEEGEEEEENDEGNIDISGIQQTFAFDHCRDHGNLYAFQIAYAEVEPYSIRISTTNSDAPVCSCEIKDGTCRHVQWLLQQLSKANVTAHRGIDDGPYAQISSIGLDNVCEELHWQFLAPGSKTEYAEWQLTKPFPTHNVGPNTRAMTRERIRTVRDIMATMSPVVTDDYREDVFGSLDTITSDNIFVPRDLEATLSRLLILDDNIFQRFDSVVPINERASEYFRKMVLKALNTCNRLDQYCEVGPVDGRHDDLIWCAQELIDIVDLIQQNVSDRQPLTWLSREEAAKALVAILQMVVKDHNHDVYQRLTWPRRRRHAEPHIERNLYLRLIGSPRRVTPAFVIQALEDLPEARSCVEELEEILSILQSIGWGPAPAAYIDRLNALIARLRHASNSGSGGPSPPRGPSPSSFGPGTSKSSTAPGKRPAGSMDRKAKRMK